MMAEIFSIAFEQKKQIQQKHTSIYTFMYVVIKQKIKYMTQVRTVLNINI
jgi:hypothetical protein